MSQASGIPRRLQLAALWTTVMFLYVYGDFFGLFQKGRLAEMNRGIIGPLGDATPGVLTGVALMMAIPSLMISLSLLLPRRAARWTNVGFGLLYSLIMVATLPGAPPFYLALAVLEIGTTLAIAWLAFQWGDEAS